MKLWVKFQNFTYPVILTSLVWLVFQAGYFNKKDNKPKQTKRFVCKVIDDFNKCLIISNVVTYINGKAFEIDLGALNYCHNHLLYADPNSTMQFPYINKERNKIRKSLSIPLDKWKSIIEDLTLCEESEQRESKQLAYMRIRCYTEAAYKILRYCY